MAPRVERNTERGIDSARAPSRRPHHAAVIRRAGAFGGEGANPFDLCYRREQREILARAVACDLNHRLAVFEPSFGRAFAKSFRSAVRHRFLVLNHRLAESADFHGEKGVKKYFAFACRM